MAGQSQKHLHICEKECRRQIDILLRGAKGMTDDVLKVGACAECGCDKIDVSAMWKVTGQVDGEREQAVIAECIDCGCKCRVE